MQPQFLLEKHTPRTLAFDQRAFDDDIACKNEIHAAYPLGLVQHQNDVAVNSVARMPGAMCVFQLDEKVVAV